jgi:hypothetical protein
MSPSLMSSFPDFFRRNSGFPESEIKVPASVTLTTLHCKGMRLQKILLKDFSVDIKELIGDLAEDVKSRDFTCNALYFDPVTQKVTDLNLFYNEINQNILMEVESFEKTFAVNLSRLIRALIFKVAKESKLLNHTARIPHLL